MKIEVIEEYKADQLTPDWLFYMEPKNENSIAGEIKFTVDCVLINFNNEYWILPVDLTAKSKSIITVTNCKDVVIGAASNTINIPFQYQTLFSKGDGRGTNIDISA